MQARRWNPLLCPKNLNITALSSVSPMWRTVLQQPIRRRLSVMLDQYCTYLENLTTTMKSAQECTQYLEGTAECSLTRGGRSKMGCATIGEWEGENLQYIGIVHLNLGRRICPYFRGKTSSLKPVVVSVSCVFVAYNSVHGCVRKCQKKCHGATHPSFFNANDLLATGRLRCMHSPTRDVEA